MRSLLTVLASALLAFLAIFLLDLFDIPSIALSLLPDGALRRTLGPLLLDNKYLMMLVGWALSYFTKLVDQKFNRLLEETSREPSLSLSFPRPVSERTSPPGAAHTVIHLAQDNGGTLRRYLVCDVKNVGDHDVLGVSVNGVSVCSGSLAPGAVLRFSFCFPAKEGEDFLRGACLEVHALNERNVAFDRRYHIEFLDGLKSVSAVADGPYGRSAKRGRGKR